MKRQSSVHDVSWFLDMKRTGQLDLNPPYQRKSVWTTSDRKFFLDTIFRNYPCPPIFIHKAIDDNGLSKYYVVDGKQRLETIFLFADNKLTIDKAYGDTRLSGKNFNGLNIDEKKIFWNYSIPVDYIIDLEEIDINQIFDRVNRNSRNLQRQELRHAKYEGWFISEAESEIEKSDFWEKIKISTKANSKRMKDVQFVSELLLIILDKKIVGFDQDYLDERYGALDLIEELEFEIEEYDELKSAIKEYIKNIEDYNKAITKFAKTFNNIYTIWASVFEFHDSVDFKIFADRYIEFISIVNEFASVEDADKLLKDTSEDAYKILEDAKIKDKYKYAYIYYRNSRGASTDLPQRNERLNALNAVINL